MKMLRKIKLKALLFRRHYCSSYRYHRLDHGKHHHQQQHQHHQGKDEQVSGSGGNHQDHHRANLLKSLCNFSPFACMRSRSRPITLTGNRNNSSSSGGGGRSSGSLIPRDVHKGSCAVYVGPEQKRFVMKTCYLGHPVFGVLLQKSEEEFGFEYDGGLVIPCPVSVFEYALKLMKKTRKRYQSEVSELIQNIYSTI